MGDRSGSDAGPFRRIDGADGSSTSFYVVPFDRNGACEAEQTRAALLDELASGRHTHVVLFSHGWNNDWDAAIGRYEAFIAGFAALRAAHALPLGPPYAPLLVGVTWPSTALVLPWEEGPRFAGGPPGAGAPGREADVEDGLREAAALLPEADARRLRDLAALPRTLEPGEAREMAAMLAGLLDTERDAPWGPAPAADDLVASWRDAPTGPDADAETGADPAGDEEFGTVGGGGGGRGGAAASGRREGPADDPRAAGFLEAIDPRWAVRMFTVRLMKDRAGTVGWFGVGPLVRDVLAASAARVHLVGHSYGGKVVLSAAASSASERPIESILLLQPAVNAWCFAAAHEGRPGGYRSVLERVRQPILSTFSRRDGALTRLFHRALRRAADAGEQRIAGAPPSRFAALGGFGPQGAGDDARSIPMQLVPDRYPLSPAAGPRVLGLDGGTRIGGHGDVVNPATAWALYCQAAEP